MYGVEPVRELIAAAPGAIRTLYIRTGDEARFEEEMDSVRIAGGQVAFANEAEISRNAGAMPVIRESRPSSRSSPIPNSRTCSKPGPTPFCSSMA